MVSRVTEVKIAVGKSYSYTFFFYPFKDGSLSGKGLTLFPSLGDPFTGWNLPPGKQPLRASIKKFWPTRGAKNFSLSKKTGLSWDTF